MPAIWPWIIGIVIAWVAGCCVGSWYERWCRCQLERRKFARWADDLIERYRSWEDDDWGEANGPEISPAWRVAAFEDGSPLERKRDKSNQHKIDDDYHHDSEDFGPKRL